MDRCIWGNFILLPLRTLLGMLIGNAVPFSGIGMERHAMTSLHGILMGTGVLETASVYEWVSVCECLCAYVCVCVLGRCGEVKQAVLTAPDV